MAKPVVRNRQLVCASPESRPAVGWDFREGDKAVSVVIDGVLGGNQAHASVDASVAGLGFGLFFDYQVVPW